MTQPANHPEDALVRLAEAMGYEIRRFSRPFEAMLFRNGTPIVTRGSYTDALAWLATVLRSDFEDWDAEEIRARVKYTGTIHSRTLKVGEHLSLVWLKAWDGEKVEP